MIIAVDFDGTIVQNAYPEIGAPKYDVICALQYLQSTGNQLVLWTCRDGKDLDRAIEYCEKIHGIKFDYVNTDTNEALEQYSGRSRKVGADFYIDDRALSPDQFVMMTEMLKKSQKIAELNVLN